MIIQARHSMADLMPVWTQRSYGHSFNTEGLFTVYDYDGEFMRDALLARFPSYAPEDALPHIARDRRMPIGPYMTTEVQRVWLLQWIDIWRLAGLPIGLLLAMQGFLAPFYPRVRIVTRGDIWYTLEEGAVGRMLELPGYEPLPPAPYELGVAWVGDPAPATERLRAAGLYQRYVGDPLLWDWDSISNPENATKWWHFWGFVYPPSTAPSTLGGFPIQEPYDGFFWVYDSQTESWGFNEPWGTFTTFKSLIRTFKPAKSRCVSVIFCPNAFDFDPTTLPAFPFTPGFPDGYWGWEVKLVMGQWVPTRRTDCRYLFPEVSE